MDNQTNKQRVEPTDLCPHGKECNRKNPHHFMAYKHEHLDKIIEKNSMAHSFEQYQIPDELLEQKDLLLDQIKIINDLFRKQSQIGPNPKRFKSVENVTAQSDNPNAKMAQKLAAARPYNYFLTRVESSPPTHNEPLSITFQEIFDRSLGDLERSVQINFVVDPNWLFPQYERTGQLNKPLLILYGRELPELETMLRDKPQITAHFVRMTQFATHHTKMMLLGYKDGSMRVVVSTANLYKDDWHNRTQGLWMSEKLDAMPIGGDKAAGESVTEFRNELINYLSSYNLSHLQSWIERIQKTDFSSVNVFLITSVPGTFKESNTGHPHGHGRVAYLLSQHAAQIDDSCAIVAQSSALGNFGASADAWLTTDIVNSFRRNSQPNTFGKVPIRIIYPTLNNVQNCYGGILGADCLPYRREAHQNQLWLNDILYQWCGNGRFRSKAVPHIKTYCRWSEQKMFWFMLTSANCSKAAWGSLSKAKTSKTLRISNYEAGVLYLPKFVTNTSYFSMDPLDRSTPVFPSLYDIPLTKYTARDVPFFMDNIVMAMAMAGALNSNPM